MKNGIGAALVLGALAGCAATQLRPSAARVVVSRQPAPKSCKYLGTLIGEQGGALTGSFTSNKALAEGAVNDMKNKAADMGANYVVLEDSRAGPTISGANGAQTDVTHMGNGYACPPEEIGL
jgi:uncharacterized protein YbjQ (UPF0145 family)